MKMNGIKIWKITVLSAFVCACSGLSAAVTLSGDTTEPKTSMYELGRQAELTYSVTGLNPGEELELELNIVDENEKTVKQINLPVKGDAQGKWNGKVKAPSERLGFYRVYSKLSNGVTLPKLASRKEGFLTYAIVFGEKTLSGISDG